MLSKVAFNIKDVKRQPLFLIKQTIIFPFTQWSTGIMILGWKQIIVWYFLFYVISNTMGGNSIEKEMQPF